MQEGLIVFPYIDGSKIALEACTWIHHHVLQADYSFSDDGAIVLYVSDGVDPPRSASVLQEEEEHDV